MRSFFNDMNNDPSSSRNFDPDPIDDLEDVSEVEEHQQQSYNFYADEFRSDDSAIQVDTEESYEEEDEDFGNEEFSALNSQLDQLQSALDMLESRNAGIHQELLELLQANREVRRCITEEISAAEEEENNSSKANISVEEASAGSSSSSILEESVDTTISPAKTSPSEADGSTLLAPLVDSLKLETCTVKS